MVFSNRLDDFELTVRSLNLEEHQAVEVLREWVIDAEAMDLAPFTSCAGFSVSVRAPFFVPLGPRVVDDRSLSLASSN